MCELLPGHLVIAQTEGGRRFDTNQHVSIMLTLRNRNTHGDVGLADSERKSHGVRTGIKLVEREKEQLKRTRK
jgi:hypothetical protein